MSEPLAPQTYVAWPQVQPMFGGISRTTLWRGIRAGTHPAPHQVSAGRKAWPLSTIQAWQLSRAQQAENA